MPHEVFPVDTAAVLELRFLDVGQGDAILVRMTRPAAADPGQPDAGAAAPERLPVVLIDAGPANRIVGELRALGVERIDLLLASHNHADHIGGMDAILDSLSVTYYLDNGYPAGTRMQQRVLERVASRGVDYLEPVRRTIGLGDARLHVLPAPSGVGGEEQNNRSVSVIVERGAFRALLTGDAEVELLNALLARSDVPQVEVLKASHHGSRNGVTPAWLARTRPRVVVISVGAGNPYGHPHPFALRYYCAGQREVFRTDLHGDVMVLVEASGRYSVRLARSAPGPAASGSAGCPQTADDRAAAAAAGTRD